MPVVVHDERGLVGVAGTMGGYQQPQIDAQTIADAFALAAPTPARPSRRRGSSSTTCPRTAASRAVAAEASVPAEAVAAIEAAGFAVRRLDDLDDEVGHAHLIRGAPTAGSHAGSDPRADGGAMAG